MAKHKKPEEQKLDELQVKADEFDLQWAESLARSEAKGDDSLTIEGQLRIQQEGQQP